MRTIVAALIAALAITFTPTTTLAAPAEQQCAPGVIQQHDMAGAYVSPEYQTRVEVYPCGLIRVQWTNVYGTHEARYLTVDRAPGEGLIARAMRDNTVLVDDRAVIGVKAAERGYIQLITISPYGDDMRVYRLRKIS